MDQQKHQQFAERLMRNQHRVYGYIVSLIPHRADAEELFQQTCLTLWENWERYDSALDFFPWACGIAHNHVRNFVRKQQRAPVRLDDDVLEALAERSQTLQRQEGHRTSVLRDCLAELPTRSRAIVEDYYSGKSVARIADERTATPNVIYKLLHRARELLHECVSQKLAAEGAS